MIISTQGLSKLGFDKYTDFVLQDDSDGNGVYIKEWNSDKPQPSEAEITTAHNEWQTIYDNNQYQRDRQYASTGDQLDMLWHSIDAGEFGDTAKQSEFYTANKAVKDANPKP
jgi:hypothetical protein